MIKTILGLTLLITLSFSQVVLYEQIVSGQIQLTEEAAREIYGQYQSTYDKNLFEIFYTNLKKIVQHNSQSDKTYEMEINEFAFMSDEEFMSNYLGAQDCSATAEATLHNNQKRQYNSVPSKIDWRKLGVVSDVKDQRHCGSCWTFSTTGCLESHWALKFGVQPKLLSEQQLIDCAQEFNNHGCNGGLPSQAFEYIKKAGGLNYEFAYSYLGHNETGCRFNKNYVGAMAVGGSVNITAFDENELLQAVGSVGPVSVAFQVVPDFRFYKSGVYSSQNCSSSPEKVNHAVLAVGYDHDAASGKDYWIIKNSWNRNWGDHGYFKMERGKNMCGVATCASYPDLG